jgi:hypothetical protein
MTLTSRDDQWPVGTDEQRIRLLNARWALGPDELPRMALDTDAYNEVDDQFALVHTLLSPDRVKLEAIYAAPFHNSRSTGPGDGMWKSYQEIERVVDLVSLHRPEVFAGSEAWLTSGNAPLSPASEDLIERALKDEGGPLHVVAIGAPTNVSAALALCPEIVKNVIVIWLGGNALYWPTAREFNLYQDPLASRILLGSGVALVHVPCLGVADHLVTTRAEIGRYVAPAGRVGEFLGRRYMDYVADGAGRSSVIWDLAATAWLLDNTWTTTGMVGSPVLTSELTWSLDPGRHLIAEMVAVNRDAIFGDLFERLTTGFDGSSQRE